MAEHLDTGLGQQGLEHLAVARVELSGDQEAAATVPTGESRHASRAKCRPFRTVAVAGEQHGERLVARLGSGSGYQRCWSNPYWWRTSFSRRKP